MSAPVKYTGVIYLEDIKFLLPLRYNEETGAYAPEMYTNVAQNIYMDAESDETLDVALAGITTQLSNKANENHEHGQYLVLQEETAENLRQLRAEIPEEFQQHNTDPEAHPPLLTKIHTNMGEIVRHEMLIKRLEDALFNGIESNQFIVLFDKLDGVVVEGVWNVAQQRIEF